MSDKEHPKPSEMDPEDLPDVSAFQDEFTRGFMDSVKPTKEGYYSFISKTKAYQMDFPENMTISEKSYNIGPDNRSEILIISPKKPSGLYVENQVEYYSFLNNGERGKEQITSRVGLEITFEEVSSSFEGQHIEIAEYNYDSVTEIAALIWKDEEMGQIHTFSSIRCVDDNNSESCKKQKTDKKDQLISWLKSIEIISNESE
ncbi:hypothetical protein ACTWP4_07195 [Gracilibacillus sp. D59]|uniref:hypothetical protein n=1 Tax=Gracilibacillus sp. D59 TaxID=3457434 RepID=UPI003FCE3CBD